MTLITPILAGLVILGTVPLIVASGQWLLSGLNGFLSVFRIGPGWEPRVAVVIAAWNEAAVIDRTLQALMALQYPPGQLRVYVVDDGSSDATPSIVAAWAARTGGRVVHLRRERGGGGKAHAVNHALRHVIAEAWYEAVLVIDADVRFEPLALRRMTRHLAQERIGGVTAYIRESGEPANYLRRFIAVDYAQAQAGARRAQNVLGAHACMAGGAQLLRRDALEAIGGRIHTGSLAEDTCTTFDVQLAGFRVVFDPHAVVWAEEPPTLAGLWRQRLRWARGNVQVTRRYAHVWLRRRRGPLGSPAFAAVWFALVLAPVFMLVASAALLALHAVDPHAAGAAFRALALVTLSGYLLGVGMAFSVDPATARMCWREILCFPGLVNLVVMAWAIAAPPLERAAPGALVPLGLQTGGTAHEVVLLLSFSWVSACMLLAWVAVVLERSRVLAPLAPIALGLAGFGPLLCAITLAAYAQELRRAPRTWEKTVKQGLSGS